MTDKKPNAAQLASPAFRLAAMDQDFLLDDRQRGVRFMLEYEKAEQALRRWGVNSTIVVFGSARTNENGKGEHGRWYAAAREFARIASLRGGALDKDHKGRRDNVIATGGGGGSGGGEPRRQRRRRAVHRVQHPSPFRTGTELLFYAGADVSFSLFRYAEDALRHARRRPRRLPRRLWHVR